MTGSRAGTASRRCYLPDREERFTALIDAVEAGWQAGAPGPLVLDLGCGPGSLAVRLLARLPAATVLAVDADPVTLALGRAAHAGQPGLRFLDVDLRAPGWEAGLGIAPAGRCRRVDHRAALADRRRAGRAVPRVAGLLRPGGLFLDGDHLRLDEARNPVLARLDRALEEAEGRRRFPGGHAEDWRQWWQAVAADPALAAAAAERERGPVHHHGPESTLLAAHADALRAAGSPRSARCGSAAPTGCSRRSGRDSQRASRRRMSAGSWDRGREVSRDMGRGAGRGLSGPVTIGGHGDRLEVVGADLPGGAARNEEASMSEPKVLLTGLGIPESPRWHEGRLWFCNWIERQVVAVSLDGEAEVMATRDPGSHPMGYSIDWLPDGRLLVTGDKLRRQEPDGSMAVHAEQPANEIVVDGRGNVYLNGADFDFVAGAPPEPGYIKLVTPDGQLRQVAGDIQFPNGMVITPDGRTLIISESFAGQLTAFDIEAGGGLSNRRVFAGGVAPDGICLDAEGAVWSSAGRCPRSSASPRAASPATGRPGREPGPVRADARRTGPANPVHPDRRMAAGRRPRRQPGPAGQRAAHRGDPDTAGLRARRRAAMIRGGHV